MILCYYKANRLASYIAKSIIFSQVLSKITGGLFRKFHNTFLCHRRHSCEIFVTKLPAKLTSVVALSQCHQSLLTLALIFTCFYHSLSLAAHSVRLPVEVTSPSGILTNHTASLTLDNFNAPGFDWGNNCADVSVVDSVGSALDHFVESCDTLNQILKLWVNIPLIPASPAFTEIEIRYADPIASSTSNASATFNDTGFLYQTQPYSNADPGPQSRAAGDAIFQYDNVSTVTGYGCTQLNNVNVDNSGVFGSNSNIAYHVLSVMHVKTAGTYEFRYGSDYGHGGEISIDGIPLESDWAGELWWSLNYTHPDVLTGSRFLNAGFYTLDSLGFEICCDGPSGLQYRLAPDPWTTLSSPNTDIDLYAPDCPVEASQVLTNQHQTRVELELIKTVSNSNPSIGETVTFSIEVLNQGPFTATNYVVDDTVQAGFGSISNISNGGTLVGNQLEWVLPLLAPGSSQTVTFDAILN